MPRYKCINLLCDKCGDIITADCKITYKDGRIVDSSEKCPTCGELREVLIEEGMTTFMNGSPNICKK